MSGSHFERGRRQRKTDPVIVLRNCQIKSEAQLRLVAEALDILEVECGIGATWIKLDGCFICPDIDVRRVQRTPMQRVLARIVEKWRATQ